MTRGGREQNHYCIVWYGITSEQAQHIMAKTIATKTSEKYTITIKPSRHRPPNYEQVVVGAISHTTIPVAKSHVAVRGKRHPIFVLTQADDIKIGTSTTMSFVCNDRHLNSRLLQSVNEIEEKKNGNVTQSSIFPPVADVPWSALPPVSSTLPSISTVEHLTPNADGRTSVLSDAVPSSPLLSATGHSRRPYQSSSVHIEHTNSNGGPVSDSNVVRDIDHTHLEPTTPPQGIQSSRNTLRRGKWTAEEEDYANAVVREFNSGYLDAPAGTTLRIYLSEKLQCDPMRITKKFTGNVSIGKRVFHPTGRNGDGLSKEAREAQVSY